MSLSGLVLITVCFANVLTAQAGCCKCDCQGATNSAFHQPQLYYIPLVASQHNGGYLEGHQSYHNLAALPVPNIAHVSQAAPDKHSGYQSANQYQVTEGPSEEKLDIGRKTQDNAGMLGYQEGHQRQSSGGNGQLDASNISSTDVTQPHLSKVSTHLDTHYIKIEKKITSEQNSIKDDNPEHEKEHHHDKNDYYKFEYGVNDQKTHDIKRHKEEKNGDVVQGEYSLLEDDGNVRTVKYYADWKTGFHAQVHNSKKTSLG